VSLASEVLREKLEEKCAAAGIQTRRWYLPLLQDQPMLKSVAKPRPTPNADSLAKTLIGLPFFVDMDEQQLAKVVQVVLSVTT
jgi:dTDP-4-amino-4,6-dideoxygalactose transaminase